MTLYELENVVGSPHLQRHCQTVKPLSHFTLRDEREAAGELCVPMYSSGSIPIFDYGGGGGGVGGGGDGGDDEAAAAAGAPGVSLESGEAVKREAPTTTTTRDARVHPSAAKAVAGMVMGADDGGGTEVQPPDGVDDLVSRAQWQWALGESDRASPVRPSAARGPSGDNNNKDGGGGASSSGDGGSGGTKAAPLKRPQIRPPRAPPPPPDPSAPPKPRGTVKLPPSTKPPASPPLPPGVAAKAAVAEAQISARRKKLQVVEQLMASPAGDIPHLYTIVVPFQAQLERCFLSLNTRNHSPANTQPLAKGAHLKLSCLAKKGRWTVASP